MTDLDASSLEETAALVREAGGEAIAVAGDIVDEQTIDALTTQFLNAYGKVDGLVIDTQMTAEHQKSFAGPRKPSTRSPDGRCSSVNERTRVTVIGDGAVGLLAVLSAKLLGAEQIILMGRHQERTDLGREFGATDVVAARGEEGIEQVRQLTGGHGTHVVLEAVGHIPAYEQALGVVRPGGVISRVGVPQYDEAQVGFGSLFGRNIRPAGGPAPVRAHIEELMPAVLDGRIEPGKVFDATTDLDGVPAGYQDMADRKSLKVLVKP